MLPAELGRGRVVQAADALGRRGHGRPPRAAPGRARGPAPAAKAGWALNCRHRTGDAVPRPVRAARTPVGSSSTAARFPPVPRAPRSPRPGCGARRSGPCASTTARSGRPLFRAPRMRWANRSAAAGRRVPRPRKASTRADGSMAVDDAVGLGLRPVDPTTECQGVRCRIAACVPAVRVDQAEAFGMEPAGTGVGRRD